jgi:hypothetical protein
MQFICAARHPRILVLADHRWPKKVQWDGGRTSYFRHGAQANVQLKQLPEE